MRSRETRGTRDRSMTHSLQKTSPRSHSCLKKNENIPNISDVRTAVLLIGIVPIINYTRYLVLQNEKYAKKDVGWVYTWYEVRINSCYIGPRVEMSEMFHTSRTDQSDNDLSVYSRSPSSFSPAVVRLRGIYLPYLYSTDPTQEIYATAVDQRDYTSATPQHELDGTWYLVQNRGFIWPEFSTVSGSWGGNRLPVCLRI